MSYHPTKEILLDIYSKMNRIRKFEEAAIGLFERDEVKGALHVYVGEEAIAATVCAMLRPCDLITSTHRGHGHLIAKGIDLKLAMAEMLGKATGVCKGRGGSMHIADMDVGCLGANGIVGGGLPMSLGGGLASKYLGKDIVTVCFFGDGASNQGTFHESLNLASVWKLPVIFLCENNGYGMTVPQWQSTSVQDISVRAQGYNMPGITIDGNDVFAIYEAMDTAIARAKKMEGPTLVECKTYRWYGHWLGDPQPYRTKEEVAEWMKKDPIPRFKNRLLEIGITKEECKKIEDAANKDVAEALEFGMNSPWPDPDKLLEDVYYEPMSEV